MNLFSNKPKPDQMGVQQYRTGVMFYASYAVLLLGLLCFDWDPRFVFLGLTIEFTMGLLGNIVRTFISPAGGAALIALPFHLPALGIALGLVVSTAFVTAWHESQDEAVSGGHYALLGLAWFFINALFNAIQRFRRTSLQQVRFLDGLNAKYQFADGRPLFSKTSLALGPIVETWLVTVVFACSWGMALVIGKLLGNGDQGTLLSTPAAVAMTILCLLRQVIQARIINAVHGDGSRQEAVMLETLRSTGPIVAR